MRKTTFPTSRVFSIQSLICSTGIGAEIDSFLIITEVFNVLQICVHAQFHAQTSLMSSGRHGLYNKFAYPKLLFLNSYNNDKKY